MIADDWYPDKDWSAKWNRQLTEAGVKLSETDQCHDAHLAMVSEPELIMTIDHRGKTTPMASAIMVVNRQGCAGSTLFSTLQGTVRFRGIQIHVP